MIVLTIINACIAVIFTLCYAYQFLYLAIAIFGKPKKYPDAPPSKIAVLIAARNESAVIDGLIGSLMAQDYPKDSYRVFVVADNCTDNTAEVARNAGATVYERFNNVEKGKGYAVDHLIKAIKADYGKDGFDAFIVFDADNIVAPNYLTEMNKAFSAGYDVVSSYRNASNYGANWRAAGQGMYFLRDARVMNYARVKLGCNTFVAGTGFLFSKELSEKYGGWPFHTLTEDGEFTMCNAVEGVKTAYCHEAMFYDEQATDLKTSWNQKLRWCKGGLQIFGKYQKKLVRGIFSNKILSCFDMAMCLCAAYFISLFAIVINLVVGTVLLFTGTHISSVILPLLAVVAGAYLALFPFGLFITIAEWKKIRASGAKKILYLFTFPVFILSFIPAAAVAIFKKVEWKQIKHEGAATNLKENAPEAQEAPVAESESTESAGSSESDEKELVTK